MATTGPVAARFGAVGNGRKSHRRCVGAGLRKPRGVRHDVSQAVRANPQPVFRGSLTVRRTSRLFLLLDALRGHRRPVTATQLSQTLTFSPVANSSKARSNRAC